MRRQKKSFISLALTALVISGAGAPLVTQAEEPATAQNDPARIDRDGKRICGFDLMSESERAGFRSQLYFNKDPKDRDLIRTENCNRMKKRAAEKGVKLDE